MADRTGRALGKLDPIVYFENAAGEIALPPTTADARYIYQRAWRSRGYEWREASTLAEVDLLQKRLVAIEERKISRDLARHQELREAARKQVASNLYARLASAGASDYEKEFIRLWLELRDQAKRDKYRVALEQRNLFLYSREMNDNSKATDHVKSAEGDIWRP